MMILAALLLAAACTPLPVCGMSATPPVVAIQSVGVDLGVTGSASLSPSAPVAIGNTIIVAVRAGGHSSHALTASDSHGNVYTALGSVAAPGPSTLAMFAAPVNAAGTITVSVMDASTPGPIRMIVREYVGLGALGTATATNGSGASIPLGGALAAVVTSSSQSAVTADADVQSVNGKLFGLHGAPSLALSSSSAWTILSVPIPATLGPCETPTPVITWDQVPDADLKGYSLYYNEPGGTPQLVRDIPCVWDDRSDPPDGIKETRTCLGPDVWLALQREGNFTPGRAYEFRVKALDMDGNRSAEYSNVLTVCFRPLCAIRTGPCS